MSLRVLTRAALLLALTLLFQSLRFVIPLPTAFSTLLIGSLVNACLVIALTVTGVWPAFLIALVAPVVAWMQSLLPLPVFIFPVAIGNCLYLVCFKLLCIKRRTWQTIIVASLSKMAWLYCSFWFLLSFLNLPGKMAAVLLLAMSWPQFVTGCIGGMLAVHIKKRIK